MTLEQQQKAQAAYEHATNLLEAIFKTYHDNVDQEYNVEAGMNCFDVLLQYSMMQVALSDNNLKAAELKYISSLSKHSNICEYLEYKGYKDVTWENLMRADVAQLKKIINDMRKEMVELSTGFVNIFPRIDYEYKDADLLQEFTQFVVYIVCTVAEVDDDYHESEIKESNCLIFSALSFIKQTIEELEKNGGEPSGDGKDKKGEERKRLKDYYKVNPTSLDLNPESPKRINYADKEKAIAYIETDRGSGSGFMISPKGLCFTCYHVIDESCEIFVRLGEEKENRSVYRAQVIFGDKDEDFAILQLDNCVNNYFFELEEDSNTIKTGDDVALYGFPFGSELNEDVMDLEPSLTKGYIASRNKIMGHKCFYLDILSAPGNSGGPAFSLKTNKVIGYLCGSYGSDRANIIFIRCLEKLFNKNEKK